MTPEAADLLAKACGDLEDARKIMGISLATVAARSSYYAAFHAAEALIFELTGKVGKTHAGVRIEFARLLKGITGQDRALLTFLAQAYKFKEISDYGVGQSAVVAGAEANDAIAKAEAFVSQIKAWLERE